MSCRINTHRPGTHTLDAAAGRTPSHNAVAPQPALLRPAAASAAGPAFGDLPLYADPKFEREDDAAAGQASPEPELIPKDHEEQQRHEAAASLVLGAPAASGAAAPGRHTLATVLRPGRAPQNFMASGLRAPLDRPHAQGVAPGGAPTVGNGSNDCTPSAGGSVLSWNVVSADADHWGVSVQSLTLAGQVNVAPWTSNPSSLTVPNTPNPVDGGNIENNPGSSNHWQAAIDDMADYNQAGGGRGPNWHSTAASSAHEWAHWNTDYVADSVNSAAGGNWPACNTALDAMRVAKAGHPDEASARAALQGRVDNRMAVWRNATVTRWNAIPDTAGVAGSTGYIAGQAVLDGLIAAVRAYATTKGWNAPRPAAPAAPAAPGAPSP